MARKFSAKSLDNLRGVHPDLIRVVKHALEISPVDFSVIEGLRTVARQKQLVASGASQTMNSRHLYGMAVDLFPIDPNTGKGSWDWKWFHQLAPAVKEAATIEQVPLTWGGDWTTFKDGPHFELPHAKYPNDTKFVATAPEDVLTRGTEPVVVVDNKDKLTEELVREFVENLKTIWRS